MIQYAALLLMLEQLTGITAAAYYHTISDAHIYEDQMDSVMVMLGQPGPQAAHRRPDRGRREGG